jgi:hypothetical protein
MWLHDEVLCCSVEQQHRLTGYLCVVSLEMMEDGKRSGHYPKFGMATGDCAAGLVEPGGSSYCARLEPDPIE